MRDRHKMHLVNGHRRAASNGHRRAAPDAFTATICRDVQGHYYVTPDPGKVTCKNCARLVLEVARYCETRARGAAVMEPLVQRWFARWGHRIR